LLPENHYSQVVSLSKQNIFVLEHKYNICCTNTSLCSQTQGPRRHFEWTTAILSRLFPSVLPCLNVPYMCFLRNHYSPIICIKIIACVYAIVIKFCLNFITTRWTTNPFYIRMWAADQKV